MVNVSIINEIMILKAKFKVNLKNYNIYHKYFMKSVVTNVYVHQLILPVIKHNIW